MAEMPQLPPELADKVNEMLEAATSAPAGADASDGLLFGMTTLALALAFLFSLLGVAYLVYAKKQARLIIGLCGIGLVMFPFFVTDALAIAIIGAILVFLPAALKRAGIDL